MMKKLLCLLLAVLTILSLSACTEPVYEEEYIEPTAGAEAVDGSKNDYGDAIRLMMKTFDNSFTKEELKNMFPEECWVYFETKNGASLDDIYNSFSGRMAEKWKQMQEQVGPDAAVKYEILDRSDYTGEDYDALKEKLEQFYGISQESFGICYEVKVKKATMGQLQEDIYTRHYHVLEINGSWYISEVLTEML